MPVTGRMPIGHLLIDANPNHGLVIWECEECGALINNIDLHEKWHENLLQMFDVINQRMEN
jgi:hypothetical protein